jgi:alcohol dehydrogenase
MERKSICIENLWHRNITITTRLVDTLSTPMPLDSLRSQRINPKLLITHRFNQRFDSYESFGRAADTSALKVIIEAF